MDVKIYTTPTCGYCNQAKSFLGELGIDYKEYDVSRDHAAAEEMVKLTGQIGVPVIVVDGQVVVGFNRPRLQQLLAGRGNRKPLHLGLKVSDASRLPRKAGEPPVFGAVVGSVVLSSPGERAGIRVGDIITSINHKRIYNVGVLEQVLRELSSSNHIPVTFYRGEKAIRAEIVI